MGLKDAEPTGDRELWTRAVDGDREAFGQIFDRHATAVQSTDPQENGSMKK